MSIQRSSLVGLALKMACHGLAAAALGFAVSATLLATFPLLPNVLLVVMPLGFGLLAVHAASQANSADDPPNTIASRRSSSSTRASVG